MRVDRRSTEAYPESLNRCGFWPLCVTTEPDRATIVSVMTQIEGSTCRAPGPASLKVTNAKEHLRSLSVQRAARPPALAGS